MNLFIYPVAIAAIAALACASSGSASLAPSGLRPADLAVVQGTDGRMLYLKNCRQCHSASGAPSSETKAKYPKIKSLNDSAFLASLPDDSILTVIRKGAGKDMKSFSDRMNGEEMLAVVKYVRTLPSKK